METTTAPLPHEIPDGEAFFSMGYESLNAFHERYPFLPGYPVRCTEGNGVLLSIEPIPGTNPEQHVANIDLGYDKGWTTNMSFVRHASWGVKQAKAKCFTWPSISALSPVALELLGEPGTPLRESYEAMLHEQTHGKPTVDVSQGAFAASGLNDVAAFNKQTMPEGTEVRIPSGATGTVMTIKGNTIWVDKGNDNCWQGDVGLVRHTSWK